MVSGVDVVAEFLRIVVEYFSRRWCCLVCDRLFEV